MEKNYKLIIKISVVVVIFLLLLIFNPLVIIKAGHRGVVLNWGAVSDNIMNEGIHWRTPIYQKVIKLDVRTQKIEVNALSYSKDIQTVNAQIALNYHILPEGVNKIYQEVGTGYNDVIIQPAIQESVKAATAKFTAQELIDQRPLVKDEIKNFLKERLEGWKIVVDEFSINNFDFSEQYEKAIEEKQVAQQSALKAQNDLERVKLEAEQRVAQATAEAEAIKIQAQAITQQGGRDYVQLKAIEKWNGSLPTQMIPGGTVPFLDLSK